MRAKPKRAATFSREVETTVGAREERAIKYSRDMTTSTERERERGVDTCEGGYRKKNKKKKNKKKKKKKRRWTWRERGGAIDRANINVEELIIRGKEEK